MSAPASEADWAARDRAFSAGRPSPGAVEEARRRAFVAARRHTRLVRFLRVATPASVVVGVAALVFGALFHPFQAIPGDISIGSLGIDGVKITMGRPKLTGVRSDGRAYVVNAAKAIQDVTHPTIVELQQIDGDIGMADNQTAHITAEAGLYDSVHQTLDMSKDVRIHNPSYDVRLTSANVDFKNGVYRSEQPVTVVMSNGTTVSGDSAVARDNGSELTFVGHVRSVFAAADHEDAATDMKGQTP